MSPIIARVAMRNISATGRRQFSVVQSLRSFARSFEPHVFQRLPNTTQSQAPDYGRLIKRTGKTFATYVPLSFLILGWPALVKSGMNSRIH